MPNAIDRGDVAFNRVNVALARSQSLVASWLPPRSAEDQAAQKTAEQCQQEDSTLFTQGSEILGVGAEPPNEILDGNLKRNQLSSNDRLCQHIFGKHVTNRRAEQRVRRGLATGVHLPSKTLDREVKSQKVQESGDDVDSRAAMFKSKQKGNTHVKAEAKHERREPQIQKKSKRQPVSFLDELLGERSRKKRKGKGKEMQGKHQNKTVTGEEQNSHSPKEGIPKQTPATAEEDTREADSKEAAKSKEQPKSDISMREPTLPDRSGRKRRRRKKGRKEKRRTGA